MTTEAMSWGELAMGLGGGLALFLYGMDRMSHALRAVGGSRTKQVLAALSNNRVIGLLTGLVVTAVIQSSSVTTVMLVGFVSASMMSLTQAIGVILGANIGTTVTAQIVAFKVTKYALGFVALGFAMTFTARRSAIRDYGMVVMGLGLIFFGMAVMSDAMHPLRSYPPFIEAMAAMSNPLAGIAAAAAFTALVQSSSATMGVVIVLAMQGLIDLDAGVALALGANIGTCVTAGLAAIGKPREAVRVAVAHVSFKLIGVALILPVLPSFVDAVRQLSPGAEGATLAEVVPRQIANAHTLFNVAITLLFLPFTTVFARGLTRLVRDRPGELEAAVIQDKHLDKLLLDSPELALAAARQELGRVGRRVLAMYDDILPALLIGTVEELKGIRRKDEEIDELHRRVVRYLGEISRSDLSQHHTEELMGLMNSANQLEAIGDIVETDLVRLALRRIDDDIEISDETAAVLGEVYGKVREVLHDAVEGLCSRDVDAARQARQAKAAVKGLLHEAELHQARRLVAPEPHRLHAYTLEIEVIDRLRTIHSQARRIAKIAAA